MLIKFKQFKAHNLILDKQFSNSLHLIFPFQKVMEREGVEVEEKEDNIDPLHMTELTITIIANLPV